ncbi:MAG: hypothetical protein O7E57_00975 [Gammaproteobacteria bacterium]|nr:hypothetical protein [Gammaproteobacteria bacterium]
MLGRSVRLCQEGNRGEFKAIVDAYSQRLHRIAWLITRDHGIARNAIQSSMLWAKSNGQGRAIRSTNSGRAWHMSPSALGVMGSVALFVVDYEP